MSSEKEKIQELAFLEQSLQNLLLQKQSFQMELAETDAALKELKNSGEEVYKMIGQMMIKTSKEEMEKELNEKKRLLDLRTQSFEKQEQTLSDQADKLRKEFLEKKK